MTTCSRFATIVVHVVVLLGLIRKDARKIESAGSTTKNGTHTCFPKIETIITLQNSDVHHQSHGFRFHHDRRGRLPHPYAVISAAAPTAVATLAAAAPGVIAFASLGATRGQAHRDGPAQLVH